MKKMGIFFICLTLLFNMLVPVYAQESASSQDFLNGYESERIFTSQEKAETMPNSASISPMAAAPGIVSGQTYFIVNANSNKLLDCSNAGTTTGTNVLQWWNMGDSNQKWKVTLLSDGYYRISPVHAPNMCLDVLNNGTANGDNVGIYALSGSGTPWDSSKWIITKLGENDDSAGNYKIGSKLSGGSKVLTVSGASHDNGANVIMYSYSSGRPTNDEWIFIPVQSVNLVETAIHQDPSYLDCFAGEPHNINMVMADVTKPFYTRWGISIEPFYYNISYLPLEECTFSYWVHCQSLSSACGTICANSYTWPNHHKNFDYNAHYEWQHYGDDNRDLRLAVSAGAFCHMHNGAHCLCALGMCNDTKGKNTMAFNNRGYMLNVRVIQHELSHSFGCPDNCGAQDRDERCIMDGGFDRDNSFNHATIWCSHCEADFDRNAH